MKEGLTLLLLFFNLKIIMTDKEPTNYANLRNLASCGTYNSLTTCYSYCDCYYSSSSSRSNCKSNCDSTYSSSSSSSSTGAIVGGIVGGVVGVIILVVVIIVLTRLCANRTYFVQSDPYYQSIIKHPAPPSSTYNQNNMMQQYPYNPQMQKFGVQPMQYNQSNMQQSYLI